VTPEAADYLAKARDDITKARDWLHAVHRGDEAARVAYLAAFHAAQALIFERTGNVAKTHRGVRSAFARLTEDDTRFDRTLRQFLGRGYQRKEIADYGVGSQPPMSEAEAREMIETAVRFIDRVASMLA
jgi:uncharacterized protein (UPF0332 family)